MNPPILSIPATTKTDIRISVADFKDVRRADIRVFFKNDDGEYFPTRKGVSIPLDYIPKVIEALQAVMADKA